MKKNTEIHYEMKLLSSLAKVFPDETPVYRPECLLLSALWGETVSFQAAYTGDFFMRERLDVKITSPREMIRYEREQVPWDGSTNGIVDDNYLRTTSGLYPDLLRDLKDKKATVCSNQWRSLWIDVEVTARLRPESTQSKSACKKRAMQYAPAS